MVNMLQTGQAVELKEQNMSILKKTISLTFLVAFLTFATTQAAEEIQSNSTVSPPKNPVSVDTASKTSTYAVTGVAVDARGLGLETTFSPGIYDESGRCIYGNTNIDTNFAAIHGMVDYAPTPDLVAEVENGHSRAGSCPIIVKAIALRNNNHSVIVSQADAEKILAADKKDVFFSRCAVVFYD
jgi:hypothetical protein